MKYKREFSNFSAKTGKKHRFTILKVRGALMRSPFDPRAKS
jgi:hypothetical protein